MSESPQKAAIFFDSKGRRTRYTNTALLIALSLSTAGLACVSVGIIWGPKLVHLRLAEPRLHNFAGQRPILTPYEPPFQPVTVTQFQRELSAHALRFAFYSGDDLNSFRSLVSHAKDLDGLLPDWYALAALGGRIVVHKQAGAEKPLLWLRKNAPHLALFPRLSLPLRNPLMRATLFDPARQGALAKDIADTVASEQLSGVTIEINGENPELERLMVPFVNELRKRLSAEHRKLLISITPDLAPDEVHDFAALSDYVVLMTCDELPVRGTTGPVASQGWVENEIRKHLLIVPAAKLIVSIGSFGYDYDGFGDPQGISVQQAWDILSATGSRLAFDKRALSSTFLYKAKGQWHQVWFNDAVSVFNQFRTALTAAPAGIAIWRLGTEDPGLWSFVARGNAPDERQARQLSEISFGLGYLEPHNAVLARVRLGRPGGRVVHLNPALNLIDDEHYTAFPGLAEVETWQAVNPKMVALTFDDGPDGTYTPQILDILADRHVKATFYVIGQNALTNLNVLRRIHREGHDIGSHTFTHPNLDETSMVRAVAELNANQRLLQSTLGISTVLFRAPYESSGFGFLDSSPQVIQVVHRLGYLWGGFNTDTDDYLRLPDQSDWIVSDVLRQVQETKGFHVVLMHDGGGHREATVKALPEIIDRLRAKGYVLVTTHELVGLPQKALMPPTRASSALDTTQAGLRRGSIQVLGFLVDTVPLVAIIAAILGTARLLLIVILAAIQHSRRRTTLVRPNRRGSIAVVVPAKNEENVICKTVQAIIEGRSRRNIRVIVVDDGSTDATAEAVRQTFAGDPRVKVFSKPNGGKASALNFAYRKTRCQIVIAIDGDTILEAGAIDKLAQHFDDPSVGAVAGKVTVGNQVNLMTRFQALEYVTSQNLDRLAFEPFNAIAVVPGAIGAWRRKAVLSVGGYAEDNLAEDADLTVRLALAGWRIVACPEARAFTEAPETLDSFLRQRFRWMFGMLQVACKHVYSLFRRPSGISLISIPNIFVFQFGFTLLAPIMDLILCFDLLMGIGAWLGLTQFPTSTLLRVGVYWLIFQAADLLAAAAGVHFNGERRYWRLLPLVFLQRFTYRQLLYWIAVKALLTALRGTLVGWGRSVRTGNVELPASLPRVSVSREEPCAKAMLVFARP